MFKRSAIAHSRGVRMYWGWLLLAGSLAGLALLQPRIDRASKEVKVYPETLYVSSGTALRHLSMGYDGLLADLYWIRVVQYFGRRRLAHAKRFNLLGPLLRVTTELDPHLLIAYRFGAIFLAEKSPEGASEPRQALQLVRRGIVANAAYWRLWQDLGFIYYWDLHDYKRAAAAFRTGSERPGAMVWMRAMAATVAAQGGEPQTSRALWSEIYRTAQTDSVRRSAVAHLEALKAEEDLSHLGTLVARYQKQYGSRPKSLRDLVRTGYLTGNPVDPSGAVYVLGPGAEVALGPASRINRNLLSARPLQGEAHPAMTNRR